MILELMQSLLYPEFYKSHSRNWVIDSIALKSRYHRLRKEWSPHIFECRSMIQNFLELTSDSNQILEEPPKQNSLLRSKPRLPKFEIWGSGYLEEVPKSALESKSGVLVDLFFPHVVQSWAQKNKWFCHQQDLTKPFAPLAESVISCNVLSQIPLFDQRINQEEAFKSHWHQLQNYNSFLIISDFEKRILSPNKKLIEVHPTVDHKNLNKKLGPPLKVWSWSLAPLGEFSRQFSVELKVGAWIYLDQR